MKIIFGIQAHFGILGFSYRYFPRRLLQKLLECSEALAKAFHYCYKMTRIMMIYLELQRMEKTRFILGNKRGFGEGNFEKFPGIFKQKTLSMENFYFKTFF